MKDESSIVGFLHTMLDDARDLPHCLTFASF